MLSQIGSQEEQSNILAGRQSERAHVKDDICPGFHRLAGEQIVPHHRFELIPEDIPLNEITGRDAAA